MQKIIAINPEVISKVIASILVSLVLVGYLTYQVGYHQGSRDGDRKSLTQTDLYTEQQRKDRLALDRMTSSYNAACYNYQVLYDAYDELYKKAGVGHEQVVRPDGARGNENSCYR